MRSMTAKMQLKSCLNPLIKITHGGLRTIFLLYVMPCCGPDFTGSRVHTYAHLLAIADTLKYIQRRASPARWIQQRPHSTVNCSKVLVLDGIKEKRTIQRRQFQREKRVLETIGKIIKRAKENCRQTRLKEETDDVPDSSFLSMPKQLSKFDWCRSYFIWKNHILTSLHICILCLLSIQHDQCLRMHGDSCTALHHT